MLRLLLVVLVLLSAAPAHAAPLSEAPDTASYQIRATLDPQAKTVTGTARITYTNPSPDTLSEIWMRLYLRAFSSMDTYWMRESGGQNRGFEVSPTELGDLTVQTLALADGTDLLATATMSETLMQVPLPQPLAPGQPLELDVTWVSTLPRAFARTGYGGANDTFFMVGQWYPKMAVYDRGAWDTAPWHPNSEFFHDFGTYDLTVDVPEAYVVAGPGVPTEETVRAGRKQARFLAEGVTDVAFAASPDFRTAQAQQGDTVIDLYYLPEHETSVDEYLTTAVDSLQLMGEWFGTYPHPRLTIVDVPDDTPGAGGMEYPTLVTGGTLGLPADAGPVALVTAHEIGHQWWPMQTATNEAREPWLDEGLTEYSGMRVMLATERELGIGGLRLSADIMDTAGMLGGAAVDVSRPAWEYNETSYGAVYSKTALGLWTLERLVGSDRFFAAMQAYLREYRYKHPTAAEFRASIEASLGSQPWFFDAFVTGGQIDYAVQAIAADGLSVTVENQGTVPVPVPVRLTLASGATRTEQMDGSAEQTFTVSPTDPIRSVVIDPDRLLRAELDVLDNSASSRIQTGPAISIGGRLAFWVQVVLQSVGLFG